MPIINITVKGKVASSNTKAIVNGNSDYTVNWVLDGEWSDFDTKTMRVRHYDGTVIDCIFTGCSCSLPIITETCMIEIGLFAGNLITSTPATISCTRCIMDDEGPVKDPMPDVYAQIMERLNNLDGIAPATSDKLGVVKIGDNLKITEEGVLSVDTAEAVGDALADKQDTLIQSGASVGQIVKISAVDDMGKPTAWEAINIPESAQPDWNQNDNTQPDYVKNRPFYSETRNVTIEDAEYVALDGFPAFVTGDTVTVNVDGVEHSLVAYYDEDEGVFTIGDIYSDLENGKGQLGWQIWYSSGDNKAWFYATEAHTISYLGVFIYKIDNKFVNFDGLVRTFKGEWLYKTLYNSAGDSCTLYTCSDFILPDQDAQLFGFMSEFGFSKVDSVGLYSCFITGFIIAPMSARVRIARVVLGTDTSYMETMAADNGYTYTTNPNA